MYTRTLRRLSITMLSCVLSLFCFSQSTNTAFLAGEKLTYTGSYNMSSLWTDIARVTLETSEAKAANQSLLNLRMTATTFTSWDNYFKIRDLYQSWVDPVTTLPLVFKRDMYEGGYTKDAKYVFKRKSLLAIASDKRKDGSIKQTSIKITPTVHDLISVLYYARTLDYSAMPVNKVIRVTVLIDNKLETINIKFKGIEDIKIEKYGTRKCYKLGVSINNEKIVKTRETNNIWLTADKNKVPVLIKADIPVGSVQLRLTEMTGLRNK